MDAADLLDDAVVKPLEPNIQPQYSSVDRNPYTGSAIEHFEKAGKLFEQYNSEIADGLEGLNKSLEEMRAILEENAKAWGLSYIPPVR